MKLRPTTDAEKIGRILEEKEMPIQEMITLWTDVFPTLVIWSTEEIRQHLTELFEFNEDEADTLIEKYKTKVQNEKLQQILKITGAIEALQGLTEPDAACEVVSE